MRSGGRIGFGISLRLSFLVIGLGMDRHLLAVGMMGFGWDRHCLCFGLEVGMARRNLGIGLEVGMARRILGMRHGGHLEWVGKRSGGLPHNLVEGVFSFYA